MTARTLLHRVGGAFGRAIRHFHGKSRPVGAVALAICALHLAAPVQAAPFAAFVMDARTGKTLHAQNAETQLHPASLTKMMTLYMAFTAIERGQVRLDSRFVVSANAAAEPPSRLGLKAGQQIELRYLIRAAAVKSANDAATAIAEGLGGSEAAFARQMTGMARALGMRNTNFLNANGLTEVGHYSTAHDMTILGRRLFYDFPQYYSIFSRRSADAGIATVRSTNRDFLDNYQGADGIKTGYTRAAGFNLTASAQRGSKRIIATVMGGTSTGQRNAVMAKLLDSGFGAAPTRVREVRPEAPDFVIERKAQRRVPEEAVKTIAQSPRPVAAPSPSTATSVSQAALTAALDQAMKTPSPAASAPASATRVTALTRSARPAARPRTAVAAVADAPAPQTAAAASLAASVTADPPPVPSAAAGVVVASSRPKPRPEEGSDAGIVSHKEQVSLAGKDLASLIDAQRPVSRADRVLIAPASDNTDTRPVEKRQRVAAGSGSYSILLGFYETRNQAEERAVQAAIQHSDVLEQGRRSVINAPRGWEASIVRLSKSSADLACQKLHAQGQKCTVYGP